MKPQQKVPDGQYKLCQDSRRFMIYVHSKFCVVDDEVCTCTWAAPSLTLCCQLP